MELDDWQVRDILACMHIDAVVERLGAEGKDGIQATAAAMQTEYWG